jgi:hypothetical protein
MSGALENYHTPNTTLTFSSAWPLKYEGIFELLLFPEYQRWFDVKKLSRTYLIASLTLPNITKVIIFYQSINIHYIIITTLLTQPKIGSPVVP